MGRLDRWRGVVGLALARVWVRATRTAPRQVGFTVTGVALPVALLVVVTSVSLGLAGGGTVQSEDVDYWIVPEAGASSAVVDVGGPRFGGVHGVSERLRAREDVSYATPVLLELVRVESGDAEEYVVAVGVVPGEEPIDIAGASTAGLAAGDPHYADGSYDGPWTDEVVLSAGAAELIGVGQGDSVRVVASASRNRTVDVVNVSSSDPAVGNLPVVVTRLGELQSLTGTDDGDRADQVLVRTTDPGVRADLEAVYPRSIVVEKGGVGAREVVDSSLALAVGLTALAVALIVGVLFAATTLGLAVAAASKERAVLAALGFSGRSRAVLLAVEALVVTAAGGVLGAFAGVGAIPLVNQAATRYVADVTVARAHPALAAYGVGVALLIGLLVLPYLLVMSRRTATVGALTE